MHWNARRIVFVVFGLIVFVVAAAMPGVGQQASQKHRKTTDPPLPAQGRFGQDLFLAIDHRDLAAVRALIKRGADINARNGLEFTPLYVAAASHQPDVMEALLAAHAEVDAESPYGTPLTFAAESAHTAGARMLMARGAKVNIARADGTTVLMMASYSGDPTLVKDLIDRKARVDAKNISGATALSYASKAGNLEAARVLLDAGATIDKADIDGQTPLMAAAKAGHSEVVKLLLERGANVKTSDKRGRTALHLASSYGDYPDVVRALLDGGADPKARDSKGRTAADLASMRGYSAAANMLGRPVSVARRDAKRAATLSLKLLERSMTAFSQNTGCISCHQEGLGRITTGMARKYGFKVDPRLTKAQNDRIRGMLTVMRPLHVQALNSPEAMKQVPLIEINEVNTIDGWLLSGMAAQGDPPTAGTAACAMVLARQQSPAGFWGFSVPRVPMQSSPITFTALAIRSLRAYGPKANSAELTGRIAKAKAWLAKAPAKTSDDLAFRLLGLKWAGATASERRIAVEDLRAQQQDDGGWAQMPGMHSDAYATGQALYALRVGGGVPASDPACAKAQEFLLRTQDDDGSWFVNKRAMPANNYFDAAFPHGESQYASFNATCWATLGLFETMGRQ